MRQRFQTASRITDRTAGTVIADRALVASTVRERTRGLLGRDGMADGEALVIPDCRQVHTFFMRFQIDVIFLDAQGIVLLTRSLAPNRISPLVWKAKTVVETPAGTLKRTGVREGDMLSIDSDPNRPEPDRFNKGAGHFC